MFGDQTYSSQRFISVTKPKQWGFEAHRGKLHLRIVQPNGNVARSVNTQRHKDPVILSVRADGPGHVTVGILQFLAWLFSDKKP